MATNPQVVVCPQLQSWCSPKGPRPVTSVSGLFAAQPLTAQASTSCRSVCSSHQVAPSQPHAEADLGPHGQAPEQTPGAWLTKHHPNSSTTNTPKRRTQLAPQLCSCPAPWGQPPSQQLTLHYSRGTAAQKGPGTFGKQLSDFRARAGEAAFSKTETLAGATVPALSPPPTRPVGTGITPE